MNNQLKRLERTVGMQFALSSSMTMTLRGAAVVCVAILSACGAASGEPSATAFPLAVGETLAVTSRLQSLTFRNYGDGFRPAEPADVCNRYAYTYIVKFEGMKQTIDAETCDGKTKQTKTRTLSEMGAAQLNAVLKKLTVVAAPGACGADKPTLEVELKTEGKITVYADEFYSCIAKDKPLVSSSFLSELETTLRQVN
jgi:hypothetical protein